MTDRIKLYCFPYAGGSAVIFNGIKRLLSDTIDVIPIEYKGRGKRFKETHYNSLSEIVDEAVSLIDNLSDNSSYSLLGYSFGSLITYELVKKLLQEKKRLPIHVFFMACHAPHNRYGNYEFHKLSNEKLTEVLLTLGGIDETIVSNTELLNIFLPIIKNDFKIYELYDITQDRVKIPVPISVVNGKKDTLITVENAEEWNFYAGSTCEFLYFDEDHYFIRNKDLEISLLIEKRLYRKITK